MWQRFFRVICPSSFSKRSYRKLHKICWLVSDDFRLSTFVEVKCQVAGLPHLGEMSLRPLRCSSVGRSSFFQGIFQIVFIPWTSLAGRVWTFSIIRMCFRRNGDHTGLAYSTCGRCIQLFERIYIKETRRSPDESHYSIDFWFHVFFKSHFIRIFWGMVRTHDNRCRFGMRRHPQSLRLNTENLCVVSTILWISKIGLGNRLCETLASLW